MKNALLLTFIATHGSTINFSPHSQEYKILNMLSYATGAGGGFGGTFSAGYHTIKLGTQIIPGQRNPEMRLQSVPYDFTGKTVLDMGANIGGMLFAVKDKIKYAVGVDINVRAVNAANLLKSYYHSNHLNFYCFDLEKENLLLLKNLFPDEKIDICFMLSMAAWVSNWQDIIVFASSVANSLLYEAHGPASAQIVQTDYLARFYKTVTLINATSEDDPINKNRSLYLCTN